jgi:hypothetical protein
VSDACLQEFIAAHASQPTCDFCGRSADVDIAADTDLVLSEISRAVRTAWTTAEDEGLTPNADDALGQSALHDFRDVLEEEEALPLGEQSFEEFVLGAFQESMWCRRDPFVITERDALSYSWERFREVVMHENRYFFTPLVAGDGGPDLVHEGVEMLRQIGGLIEKYGLIREVDPGTDLHRVRIHDADKEYSTAAELGTPPRDRASQNRMSPAGIEMFYVATDRDTALAETLSPDDVGSVASASVFHLRQPLRVVDFDGVPEFPSIFDPDGSAITERNAIGFLLGFRRDLSRPIERDDRIHIEYVPTQVVCEYLKTRFNPDGGLVHGLAFDSARTVSGRNWAFFIGHDYCVDPGEQVFFKDRPVAELGPAERLSVDEALLDRLGVERASSLDVVGDEIDC